jgi:PAS domain S-box-containing protein
MAEQSTTVILNVDDDDSSRYVTSKLLRRQGFEVQEARTGTEGLEMAAQGPDLILLDINLPDINGLEVCRRIKSDRRTRDIPVLHLSATAVTNHDRAAGLEGGADGYLTYPVDPALLVATIQALLRASKAEAEARAAAREWQTTFDAVSHGVCLLNREGLTVRCNRRMAELLGSTPPMLIGQPYVIPGAEPPAEGWPFERSRTSRRRETGELRVGDRWFEVTADPLLDERGEFNGAVRTLLDVTARREAEKDRDLLVRQLEHERASIEAVLQQMPAGVVLVEAPSGKVLLQNAQVARIWRHEFDAAADLQTFCNLRGFRPDGRPYEPHEWPLSRSLRNGEVVSNEEIEIIRGDKTRGWVLVSSAPIRDRHGFIVAGMLELQDISERRHLEDQFRQSQKMEAVGRLAGGVAHDFNNLLTIIGGYGQMLLDSTDANDPVHKDLEAIMEAANRAGALTRQLLTVSRRQVVQPKVFELNRLISRMNRMLRRVIGEDVELVNLLDSSRGRIKADPGQIEQVLLNLAVNARDAMPRGGRLTLQTEDLEASPDSASPNLPPGRYVRLSVIDTGTGMPPEVLKHLFEPFFTTKPKGKGTGLGLSTVYGIVKQTGADITVESEVGQGSTFRITFPAMVRMAEAEPDGAPRQAMEQVRRGTETILLVEDESDVRRLTAEMLTRQGYVVIEAASGPDAVRIWEHHNEIIDLVLTDVVMPKMSGQELAALLKESRQDLRVMYMSGYTDDVVARHGGLERAVFLQKPFTSDTLARMVRAVLDKKE